MSVQELLTYVEELEFKTSMFGYDKDEVDIQLDKICDEIEAIAKEKDTEIEALKSGQPILVQDVSEDEEEPLTEPAPVQPEEPAPAELEAKDSEIAALKEQMEAMQHKLEEAQTQAADWMKQAREAESRAVKAGEDFALAQNRAEAAEAKLAATESKLAAAGPQTKEEAYKQYIHNADLLCQQITDIQNKEESIVKNAEESAGRIMSDAQEEAERIMSGAREEAEQIMTDVQGRCKEEEDKILELKTQRGRVADSLTQITAEVQRVLKKVQDSQEV